MTQPTKRDPGWLRTWWPWYLVVGVLMFAGPETVGIVVDGEGGTLSEMSREWLGTTEGEVTPGLVVLSAVLAGFAIWFPVHLVHGWPWERKARERARARRRDDAAGSP